jgi:hypothetical protein
LKKAKNPAVPGSGERFREGTWRRKCDKRPTLSGASGFGTGSRRNPSLQSFADRLRKTGQPHKVIITAVARKRVTIADALCKSRQKWTAATA